MSAVEQALGLVEGLAVETIETGCCGMAGAFGYGAETYDTSMAMGELALLPRVRTAPADATIVADGFSCRHQIADGAGRTAVHVVRLLARAALAKLLRLLNEARGILIRERLKCELNNFRLYRRELVSSAIGRAAHAVCLFGLGFCKCVA